MERASEWTVEIYLDEGDEQTRARARLTTRDTELTGTGVARRNPRDRDVPEIGDELAVARALADLATQLFAATGADIEQVTHQPAHVVS